MTEWHVRYGGRAVMIYWHVEKGSTCIFSQLKRCSSSEVAAMTKVLLRHYTNVEIQRLYVDSHWPERPRRPFCRLLGFNLPPRLRAIAWQKLALPGLRAELPNASHSFQGPHLGGGRAAVWPQSIWAGQNDIGIASGLRSSRRREDRPVRFSRMRQLHCDRGNLDWRGRHVLRP